MTETLQHSFPVEVTGVAHDARANQSVEMLIAPDGKVESLVGTFNINERDARTLIEGFNAHQVPVVIDYDHGSMQPTGQPTPAAGWINSLRFAKGEGLYATAQWNQKALDMLRAGEYRFLSPTVEIDKHTRSAVRLDSVALTNKPAIKGGLPARIAASTTIRNTEILTMADVPAQPKEQGDDNQTMIEKLIADIKAIVGVKGTGNMVEVLTAIRDAIAEKFKGETGDAEQVAAAVRTRLGLGASAGTSEVVLAMSTFARDGAAASEVQALRNQEADRVAKEHVDRYVQANQINPKDTMAMSAALDLARTDPTKLAALMTNAAPYCPQGKSTPPTSRQATIIAASREFGADDGLQRSTSAKAFVGLKLRDSGMDALTENEARELVA